MNNNKRILRLVPGLLLGLELVLLLLPLGAALAAGSVDPTDKWAWGTNTGWISLSPDNGGVTVYSDHLEGYAWSENVGWIRMGICTGGSPCTYANNAATTYGVNNDGVGNLSGYAWSVNAGWVNFAPTGTERVTIDPVSGDFDGYAWGENVGWIHFNGTAADTTAYKAKTAWHGDLLAAYENGIAAVITTRRPSPATSNGLSIANSSFLNDAGDGIIFGHNNAAFANVHTNLPDGVDKRWARLWQLDVNDAGTNGGNVTLTFDISDAGGTGSFSGADVYFLLKRDAGSSGSFVIVPVVSSSIVGDQLTFIVAVGNLSSEFTLGATAGSPTAVEALNLNARDGSPPFGMLALGGLLGLGAFVVIVLRKRSG